MFCQPLREHGSHDFSQRCLFTFLHYLQFLSPRTSNYNLVCQPPREQSAQKCMRQQHRKPPLLEELSNRQSKLSIHPSHRHTSSAHVLYTAQASLFQRCSQTSYSPKSFSIEIKAKKLFDHPTNWHNLSEIASR